MKILHPEEMARIESLAYARGYQEESFMEIAGRGIADHVATYLLRTDPTMPVTLLVGPGNNGGDAFVAGSYLMQKGFCVNAYLPKPLDDCKPLCKKNGLRFQSHGGQILTAPSIRQGSLFLDGLFGTGFHGELRDPYAKLIREINREASAVIAIDIPSGLNGKDGSISGEAFFAKETIYLGHPKSGFFIGKGYEHVGTLRRVDFGLPLQESESSIPAFELADPNELLKAIPPIRRTQHKYSAGYIVGIAGSPGMPGAANLACLGALRSGAGIVRLLAPKGMEAELSNSPYELVKEFYSDPSQAVQASERASAVFIGPGIGSMPVKELLQGIKKPLVIDADALNAIASENLTPPPGSILTPHHGEMGRLMGKKPPKYLTIEFLENAVEYASSRQVIIVLKGAPTFILTQNRIPLVIDAGDPGMATAGSGDVLTGVITSLLAQGVPTELAAPLGVFLHARAGEKAAERRGSRGMIATDIIDALSH